jgi:hypothetical protein
MVIVSFCTAFSVYYFSIHRVFVVYSDRESPDPISQVSITKQKGKPIAIDLLSRLLHRSSKSPSSILLPVQIESNLKKISQIRIAILVPRPDRSIQKRKKKSADRSLLIGVYALYAFRVPNAHDQTLLDVCLTKCVGSERISSDTHARLSGDVCDPSPSLRPTTTAVSYRHSIVFGVFPLPWYSFRCVFLIFFQTRVHIAYLAAYFESHSHSLSTTLCRYLSYETSIPLLDRLLCKFSECFTSCGRIRKRSKR